MLPDCKVWGEIGASGLLGEHSGPIFLSSVRGELATDGWSRVAGAVSPQHVADWRRAAEAGAPCPVPSIETVLLPLGSLTDIRWWDEAEGLPEGPAFILDLIDRSSTAGGLLLRPDGEDRVAGWRPEAGALTVFGSSGLILSPTSPGADRRLAISGRITT